MSEYALQSHEVFIIKICYPNSDNAFQMINVIFIRSPWKTFLQERQQVILSQRAAGPLKVLCITDTVYGGFEVRDREWAWDRLLFNLFHRGLIMAYSGLMFLMQSWHVGMAPFKSHGNTFLQLHVSLCFHWRQIQRSHEKHFPEVPKLQLSYGYVIMWLYSH